MRQPVTTRFAPAVLILAVLVTAPVIGGVTAHALVATTLTTSATPTAVAGGTITDTATLAGGTAPGGTITFNAYGPNDATCAATPAYTSTAVPVNANGNYSNTPPFNPLVVGTYRWTAAYSGDSANNPSATACNDANETSIVSKASPAIATTASGSVAAGGNIHDTATLSSGSGANMGGSITFTLYGPNNGTCTGAAIFTNVKPVTGNGAYNSDNFTANAAGTYNWVAVYGGDANNNAVTSPCGASNEGVTVTQAGPTLATTASASVPAGGQITDQATLAGGTAPTGTITFTLFGPNNATCTGSPIFTSTKTVAGNGNYTSDPFTTTLVGTYRWVTVYSGDTNNSGITAACNATNESVAVTKAAPTVVTTASQSVLPGRQVFDTATVGAGVNPTGTMTFNLFGPNNATCAGSPVFTSTPRTVSGNGNYVSDPWTTTAVGTYRWIAAYSGDANNNAVATACADPAESVLVLRPFRDFTGDTLADVAAVNGNSAWVMPSAGDSFGSPQSWSSATFFGSLATLAGDVTGSGRNALVAVNSDSVWVMTSTGSGFAAPQRWGGPSIAGTRATVLADVNGDGRADLVTINNTGVFVRLSNGAGFDATITSPTPFYGSKATLAADVNGDGRADLVAVNGGDIWVMTSNGTGSFSSPSKWSGTPFYGSVATLAGDFTGDGKVDLVAVNGGDAWVLASTGTGFVAPAKWSSGPFYGSRLTIVGDVNGDSASDLIAVNDSSTWVALSNPGSSRFNTGSRWSNVAFFGSRATTTGQ